MTDRLQDDATALNADARAYARLLTPVAPGHVLWQPTPVSMAGSLGDCGQITDGRFYKYFNILKGDTGYPLLETTPAERDAPSTPVNLGDLKSQNNIELMMTGDDTTPARMSVSVDDNVHWANNELSFLRLLGNCTSAEFTPELRIRIREYLITNDSKIREILGDVPGTLVVLTKVVLAPSWLGAIARREAPARSRQRWFGLQVKTTQTSAQSRGNNPETDAQSGILLDNFGSYTRGPEKLSGPSHCVIVGTVQSLRRAKRTNSKAPAPWKKAFNMNAPTTEGEVAVYSSTSTDPLSEMMRLCLDHWEKYSVDLVVASWDIITDFYKAYPDKTIESIRAYRLQENKVAVFVGLVPPDSDTEPRIS